MKKDNISHFGKFFIRIPYFAYDEIARRSRVVDQEQADEFMHFFLKKLEVQEGLLIASPEFFKEVQQYLAGGLSNENSSDRYMRFLDSVLKYIFRMGSRATPFGLFAGCGLGEISDQPDCIEPLFQGHFRRQVRLDMSFLISIYEFILEKEALRPYFRYFTNNTIYPVTDKYRYVEFFTDPSGKRIYNLSTFERTEYIERILEACKLGQPFNAVVSLLIDDEISENEAQLFVQEIIQARILISELEPLVVGEEYDQQLARMLHRVISTYDSADPNILTLGKIHSHILACMTEMHALESDRNYGPEVYNTIGARLADLPANFASRNISQVDSYVDFDFPPIISAELADDIVKGLQGLLRFSGTYRSGKLKEFIAAFDKRYEGKLVPLVEVLDPESGIGYNTLSAAMLDYSPLVDDVPLPNKPGKPIVAINWDMDVHTFFFNKVLDAYKREEYVIQLSEKDLAGFPEQYEIPATFNAFVNVAYKEEGRPLINFLQIGGSSATSILGRFSFLNEDFSRLTKEVAKYEERYYGDFVVAEINHLSDTRVGNIAVRDAIRNHEIAYISKSNQPGPGIIEVSDLYLFTRQSKLILYSKKLNKCVIPRLSNAHNYNLDTLPVYKFLSDYQGEVENGGFNVVLDIGQVAEFFEFIPRIQYKHYVYAPARWSFKTNELKEIINKQDDGHVISAVCDYLLSKKISRQFYHVERADSQLLYDMDSALSMRFFIRQIAKESKILLRECLFSGNVKGLVQNKSGIFHHELLVPLKRSIPDQKGVSRGPSDELLQEASAVSKRAFLPGDEWLYFKIYAGVDTCDKIVKTIFPLIIQEGRKTDLLCKWFFLRYSDPEFHLRLRIKKPNSADAVISMLYKHLAGFIGSGLVNRITIDTYERELERYGFTTIDHAESVFEADSDLASSLLNALPEGKNSEALWLASLRVIDIYMEAFEMDKPARYLFVKKQRDAFAVEFNANKLQKRKIVNKFKDAKTKIDSAFDGNSSVPGGSALDEILIDFKLKINQIFQQAYHGDVRKEQYLTSFIHMHIIRLFRSKNRITEYVLYNYLELHYRYLMGKEKYANHVG